MRLSDCHSFHDFRRMAQARLPGPIFDYIDGAADDEVTYRRNTAAFETCQLVPNVLRGVGEIDMSVTVMGQKLAMPVYCSPTALQRLVPPRGRAGRRRCGRQAWNDVRRVLPRDGEPGRGRAGSAAVRRSISSTSTRTAA